MSLFRLQLYESNQDHFCKSHNSDFRWISGFFKSIYQWIFICERDDKKWKSKSNKAKGKVIQVKIFQDRKNIILMVLILAVLIMGYGYSVLLQELSIHGSAEIEGQTWRIEITDVKDKSVLGTAKVAEKPTFTKTSATLKNEFFHKGDSIVYEITVSNNGGLDAKLESVQIVPGDDSNGVITYNVTNVTPGATRLAVGETNKINVAVTYSKPEKLQGSEFIENMKILVNYVQDYN